MPPAGRALPLTKVSRLLLLPRGVPVESLSAGLSARECQIVASRWESRDGDRVVAGRLLFVEPPSVPAFRGSGDLPGRHETLTVDGVRVDLWRTGGPVPRYRAYWTTPAGTPHAVHAENMDGDLRILKREVRSTSRIAEAPSGDSPAPPTVLPVSGDGNGS